MSHGIPAKSIWCSGCIGQLTNCEYHPNGSDYTGREAYSPSDYVKSIVGTRYLAWDPYLREADGSECDNTTRVWVCFGYDPRHGFWMRTVDDRGPVRETNISERAIDRTWHRLDMRSGSWRLLELVGSLGRLPTEEEAKTACVALDLASLTLRRFGFLSKEGKITESGMCLLKETPSPREFVSHVKVDGIS